MPVRGATTSDGAALLPAKQAAAKQAGGPVSAAPQSPSSPPGPSRFPLFVIAITVASCLVIWWLLHAHHRAGLRRRSSGLKTVRPRESDEVWV